MRYHRIAFFLLALVALPVLGFAQALAPEVIDQINTSAKLRVSLSDGGRGTVYSPAADSTSLNFKHSAMPNRGGPTVELPGPFQVAQVTKIQVAQGTNAGKGAMIGGAIGAGLVLLAVAGTSGTYAAPSTGQAVTAAVVWTGIGAGIGALIGGHSTHWRTVYPAQGDEERETSPSRSHPF
jgi:hypothetical protein